MKLTSLNRISSLLIILVLISPLKAEEEINIWNKSKKVSPEAEKTIIGNTTEKSKIKIKTDFNKIDKNKIEIENEIQENLDEIKIFGVFDPAENDFSLDMWSGTQAEDIRSIIKRINKIKLSNTSQSFFENIFFSFAYPPPGMGDKEFVELKINWMIANNRSDLIEQTLKQNKSFHNKRKVVQFIVDENIAKANIKESCEKVNFLDKSIKDAYLEKFKIYCLIFNDKKNEAQLLYDILKEQKKSDKFFDDKINYLLGISNETSNKIKEDNLLNFYLSSITIKKFEYEPKKNTKKIIWEYLNAANLIKLDDVDDKEKLKNLEIAANQGQLQKEKIFSIYRRIPFDINNLINANNIYQTLNPSDARALIYQKFLLSDKIENKISLLFLLDDLFKKDNLSNLYSNFMSDRLKEFDPSDIPETYKEAVKNKIISEDRFIENKIKYNDKILYKSKVIKYFLGETDKKKAQKDFNKIYKKISKNRKYFFSAKDIALIDSLKKDGFEIPKSLNYSELSKKYDIPANLLNLAKTNQSAFLALKIVEIIGEDEAHELDPETIYFITYLLNQTELRKLRNEILISALPQRS